MLHKRPYLICIYENYMYWEYTCLVQYNVPLIPRGVPNVIYVTESDTGRHLSWSLEGTAGHLQYRFCSPTTYIPSDPLAVGQARISCFKPTDQLWSVRDPTKQTGHRGEAKTRPLQAHAHAHFKLERSWCRVMDGTWTWCIVLSKIPVWRCHLPLVQVVSCRMRIEVVAATNS